MKNSDGLPERILKAIVLLSAVVALVPLTLALVALVHGAAIPMARWLAPLMIIVAAIGFYRSSRPLSWLLGGVWLGLVIAYGYKFVAGWGGRRVGAGSQPARSASLALCG